MGEVEQPLVVVGGLLVPALDPMYLGDTVQRFLFTGAVASATGEP